MSICKIKNVNLCNTEYLCSLFDRKIIYYLEIESFKSRNGFTSRYNFDKNEAGTDWLMQN